MSIEEKQNFQTFQDSNFSIERPESEKEASSFIKKFYKSDQPIEIVGLGSKRGIGKSLQCSKTLSFDQIADHARAQMEKKMYKEGYRDGVRIVMVDESLSNDFVCPFIKFTDNVSEIYPGIEYLTSNKPASAFPHE